MEKGPGSKVSSVCSVEDGSSELLNEPKLGISLGDTLELANTGGSGSSLGDSVSLSLEDNVEVHTENTSGGIVFHSKIDMLIDTKSEVTCI